MIEYVARFTELARFAGDYMATDLAKVRRFENGLRLSIRGRIIRLYLQDIYSMVGTTMTIEIEDARSTQDAGASGKRKESQSSSSSGNKQRAFSSRGFQSRCHPDQGQISVAS